MSDATNPPSDITLVAGPARRAAARAVDVVTVLTWMWAMSVARILIHLPLWSDDVDPSPWGEGFLVAVTFFVLYTAYEIGFLTRTGATPGKDLMRVRVIDADTGGRPSLRQAALRTFPLSTVWLVPGLWWGIPLTAGLGATGLPDRELGRTIHDRVASTVVVHEPEIGLDDADDPEEIERARLERRSQFMPRMVNPIQLMPSQILRHPAVSRAREARDRRDR